MSARSDLAAAIKTTLGDGYQVYGYLTDVVAVPAVVVSRTSTFPRVLGQNVLEHQFTLHLLVQRTMPDVAEDAIETMFMDIAEVLQTQISGAAYWTELGETKEYTVQDTKYAGAELAITMKE